MSRRPAVQRDPRPRGLLGTCGRTGLASTVGPVLVGVIVAFAWNMAGSHGTQVPQPGAGLAPTVGTAVDQAADQAWASATQIATRLPYRSTPDPAASRGPASTGRHGARPAQVARTASAVDSARVAAYSSPRRADTTPTASSRAFQAADWSSSNRYRTASDAASRREWAPSLVRSDWTCVRTVADETPRRSAI